MPLHGFPALVTYCPLNKRQISTDVAEERVEQSDATGTVVQAIKLGDNNRSGVPNEYHKKTSGIIGPFWSSDSCSQGQSGNAKFVFLHILREFISR
jgi:hypothetical protein